MPVYEENKAVARATLGAFGGKPTVMKYWDDNHVGSVDVLRSEERPQGGVTSYGTLGLSDHSIGLESRGNPLRVELVAACYSVYNVFPNVLATSAFCVINDSHQCRPGVIFHDVVAMYEQSGSMRHAICVPPFLWKGHLSALELRTKTVTWLMIVPISEQERRYAEGKGSDELEALFECKQIDVFDLHRPSVL